MTEILLPVSVEEGFFNGKVKIYPNGTLKFILFKRPIFNPLNLERGDKGADDDFVELVEVPFDSKDTFIIDINGELHRFIRRDKIRRDFSNALRSDSLKRSKERIFDISLMNLEKWVYMVTFTLDPEKINRYNRVEINKKIQRWFQDKVKRKGLVYLICPELHLNGAVHFHGIINDALTVERSGTYNIPERDKPVRAETVLALGRSLDDFAVQEVFNVLDYPFGFSTAVRLWGDKLNVCKYITKYVTKGSDKIMGNFYYAGGKGLVREVPCEYLKEDWNAYQSSFVFSVPNSGNSVKYLTIGEL